MLSSVTFDSGTNMLDISLDGSDSVSAQVVNVPGEVARVEVSNNGSPPTPNASDVYFINITGGFGDNLIDLSSPSTADFSYLLTSTSINGGDGNDTIYGSGVMDDIHGDAGDDFIDGGEGSDNIWGNDGADVLNGGAGSDCVMGGDGNDTLWSGSGATDDSFGLDEECGLGTLDGVVDESDECGGRGAGAGGSGPGTIQANEDQYWAIDADLLIVDSAAGLLANDETTAASFVPQLSTPPTHGGITLNSDGSFTFDSLDGFAENDTFTYTLTDGVVASAPAQVTIEVGSLRIIENRPGTFVKLAFDQTGKSMEKWVGMPNGLQVHVVPPAGALATYSVLGDFTIPGTRVKKYSVKEIEGTATPLTPADTTNTDRADCYWMSRDTRQSLHLMTIPSYMVTLSGFRF